MGAHAAYVLNLQSIWAEWIGGLGGLWRVGAGLGWGWAWVKTSSGTELSSRRDRQYTI